MRLADLDGSSAIASFASLSDAVKRLALQQAASARELAAGQQAAYAQVQQTMSALLQQPVSSPTSPAQIANVVLATLQRVGGGIRSLGDGGDGPSILSADDQARLLTEVLGTRRKEKAVVRFMTPFLCDLRRSGAGAAAADPCASVLVNSEELPWLVHPSAVGRLTLRQKPDLFRSWMPFVALRGGGADQGTGPQFVFGKLAGHALQMAGCAAELYEAKVRLTERDFGELCAYQQCVPGRCLGMFFDATEFWLYETYDGNPVRLAKAAWAAAGSLDFARAFYADAPEPPLAVLLRELLRDLKLGARYVDGCCYLGSGAHGHVFRVGGEADDAAQLALKVALPIPAGDEYYLINAEYTHMLAASKRGAPVVAPVEGSLRVTAQGGGYLMQAVGDRCDVSSQARCSAAFGALAALHACNVLHGDPRVPNLLIVQGKLLWIDLRGSAVGTTGSGLCVHSARVDAGFLAKSILALSPSVDVPATVATALDAYDPAVAATAVALATATWAVRCTVSGGEQAPAVGQVA